MKGLKNVKIYYTTNIQPTYNWYITNYITDYDSRYKIAVESFALIRLNIFFIRTELIIKTSYKALNDNYCYYLITRNLILQDFLFVFNQFKKQFLGFFLTGCHLCFQFVKSYSVGIVSVKRNFKERIGNILPNIFSSSHLLIIRIQWLLK